jgi:cardiolipin synthase C
VMGLLADFARVNHRMHNKSFTADGQVAIVGGRNIADEYFGASEGPNFADLDVAVIGPVVNEVSDTFDLYWNHPTAVPIAALSGKHPTAKEFAEQRATLLGHWQTEGPSVYADSVRDSDFAHHLQNRNVPFSWGKASIVSDHPDKVLTSSDETETHLAPKLKAELQAAKREVFLITPYFVPGKGGVQLLADARRRGARVVVITNSLASTDGIPVHSGYQRYRKALLEAGVELYELKPTATAGRDRKHGGGFFGSSGSGGSSGASLHAKTFAFDRQIGFVGSYNLDPRSSRLNTEMGVLMDCPTLVKRMPETTERDLARNAYRVKLEGRRLVWSTRKDGKEVSFTTEPEASVWKRAKVVILSWLPIESLL